MSYGHSLYERLQPKTQKLIEQYRKLDISGNAQDWRWVHKYPASCLMGDIPACKTIKQAAFRHFKDMERDDIYLSQEGVDSIMTWFKFIPISNRKMEK